MRRVLARQPAAPPGAGGVRTSTGGWKRDARCRTLELSIVVQSREVAKV